MNELLTFTTPELTLFFSSLLISVIACAIYFKYFSKVLIRTFDFQRGIYLFGIVLSLLSSIALLNWETSPPDEYVIIESGIDDDMIEIPQTFLEEPKPVAPPPPPPPTPIKKATEIEKIVFVEKTIEVTQKINIVDQEDKAIHSGPPTALPSAPPPVPPMPPEKEEDSDGFVSIAEQMPRFPGCELEEDPETCTKESIINHIYSQLRYPALARENGIEGMVVVQFTIDKKGQMGEVVIRRDIGFGCGQAAADVVSSIKELSLWTPGKQRKRPVKVLYTMPVKFKLN